MTRWQPPQPGPADNQSGNDPPRPPSAPLPPAVPVSPVRRVRGPSAAPPRRDPPRQSPAQESSPAHRLPPDDSGGWDPPAGNARGWDAPRGQGFFRLIDEEQRFRQRISIWIGVAGLALVSGLLVLAWSAVQLTERENATRVLQEALAPLSDIDRLLQRDYPALLAEANAAGAATVIVQSYPLGIAIPATDLATMTALDVRARVLSDSAARIYDSGMGTFERESGGRGSFFSPRGVL